MRRLLVLFLLATSALFATPYESPAGYSIDIPNGWEWGTGLMGSDLFAIAPEGEDTGTANFNVMVGSSGGLDLDTLYGESIKGLKDLLDDVEIEQSGTGRLGSLRAKWHINSYLFQGSELKVLQYVAVKDGTAYALTFTTSDADFGHYRPTFDGIVHSFSLSDQADTQET